MRNYAAHVAMAGCLFGASTTVIAQGGLNCPLWWETTAGRGQAYNSQAATIWDPDGAGPLPPVLAMGGTGVRTYDGTTWQSLLHPGLGGVTSLAVLNGHLVAGGWNSQIAYVREWDGATWQTVGAAFGTNQIIQGNANVNAFASYNGQLIAAGFFTQAGGNTDCISIAAWDGAAWQALGSGLSLIAGGAWHPAEIRALTIYNGHLIAGGYFSHSGSVPCNELAQWDGNSWQPVGGGIDYGLGPDTQVYSLAVFNGQLIVATSWNITSWNGTTWQHLGNIGGGAYALSVFNGQLIAAGGFNYGPPSNAISIARWNGSTWRPIGSGVDGEVHALTIFNGELICGGSIQNAGGFPAPGWARLKPCCADFNDDQSLGVQDIFAFIAAWFAGDSHANINGIDGITVQDIFDYLNAWFAGCP